MPVTIGYRFGEWQVSWGYWTKHRLSFLVMVVRLYDEPPAQTEVAGAKKVQLVPERVRVVVRGVCGASNLAASTCTRTMGSDGALTELIELSGGRDGLNNEDLDRFIERFPIQRAQKRK